MSDESIPRVDSGVHATGVGGAVLELLGAPRCGSTPALLLRPAGMHVVTNARFE